MSQHAEILLFWKLIGQACHRFGFEQRGYRGTHWINDVREFLGGVSRIK